MDDDAAFYDYDDAIEDAYQAMREAVGHLRRARKIAVDARGLDHQAVMDIDEVLDISVEMNRALGLVTDIGMEPEL